jgi:hypothetical protein
VAWRVPVLRRGQPQVVASGSAQVPAVAPGVGTTHLAGARQPGPAAVSQAAPSAAGATHVPVAEPVGRTHAAPAAQRVPTPSTLPHGIPAATIGWVTHCLLFVSQVRPAAALQSGPVARFGSQVAATVAISAVQVPDTVAVAPTHAAPWAHG